MICFEDVSFSYEQNHPVLSHLSFTVEEGATVGLIGANGAGKSTVLKLMTGLLFPEGTITIGSVPVRKDTLAEIRRTCGYLLQNSDNQMFMPTVLEDMVFGPMNYGQTREEAEKKADEILAGLKCETLKNRYNHRLSGGEKRMAAIATVLAMEPKVLLMDEPTSALDPFSRRTVIETIRSLPQTKVITSHDLDMILETCKRVILLGNGCVAADGKTEDILRSRQLLEENHLELPYTFRGLY